MCATKNVRLVDHNTMLRVPYRTDSVTATVRLSNAKALFSFNTQRNPLDSFQNNPRNQVSATSGNHANAATVCVPRKKLRDTNRPEQLPSEWAAAVTLSSGAKVEPKRKQPITVFDIDSQSALPCVFDSHYRPYFVRLAPFACRVLVHIS